MIALCREDGPHFTRRVARSFQTIGVVFVVAFTEAVGYPHLGLPRRELKNTVGPCFVRGDTQTGQRRGTKPG
jgi:hypothetical protein